MSSLTNGSKFRRTGKFSTIFSCFPKILECNCLKTQRSSKVSIRNSRTWWQKHHWILKSWNHVLLKEETCLLDGLQLLRNAKRHWMTTWNRKRNLSLDSISCRINRFWQFSPTDKTHLRSASILEIVSMVWRQCFLSHLLIQMKPVRSESVWFPRMMKKSHSHRNSSAREPSNIGYCN